MSEKKLLTEWCPISIDKAMLKESKEKYGKVLLRGIIQRANTKRSN